jgi:hypothetical protein
MKSCPATKRNEGWGYSSVVEYWPSVRKALGSIPKEHVIQVTTWVYLKIFIIMTGIVVHICSPSYSRD